MHIPVLATTALTWLAPRPDGIYVDCTAGAGGHAALIAAGLDTGRLIAIDRDPGAVDMAREALRSFPQTAVYHRNFSELNDLLEQLGIRGVQGVLFDLGVSSMHLDCAGRGFSFQREGPLDMRMDTTKGLTAAAYLASVDEAELARVLGEYGDVRRAARIAEFIKARAAQGKMETTRDLADSVTAAVGRPAAESGKVSPGAGSPPDVTRNVFQAVRMALNEELNHIRSGLQQAIERLLPGGRVVVITFHSGEERLVKSVFRQYSRPVREFHPDGRLKSSTPPILRIVTPKPVLPSAEEMRANSRAKSAKLRVGERL